MQIFFLTLEIIVFIPLLAWIDDFYLHKTYVLCYITFVSPQRLLIYFFAIKEKWYKTVCALCVKLGDWSLSLQIKYINGSSLLLLRHSPLFLLNFICSVNSWLLFSLSLFRHPHLMFLIVIYCLGLFLLAWNRRRSSRICLSLPLPSYCQQWVAYGKQSHYLLS